jgi:hypothetical protein
LVLSIASSLRSSKGKAQVGRPAIAGDVFPIA